MTTAWSITEDILPWLGFTVAFVMVLLIPVRPNGPVGHGAKWFFVASILCYMIGTSSSILVHMISVPEGVLTVVDAIEVMLIPFILFAVYSMYARQQLNDALATQQTLVQASNMMETIVETTPAGIVVLDGSGWITFANGAARRLLDLEEDPELCTIRTPGWRITCGDAGSREPRTDFRDLVTGGLVEAVPVTVEWPNGWRRVIEVNAEPILGADGNTNGAIVAFLDTEAHAAAGA